MEIHGWALFPRQLGALAIAGIGWSKRQALRRRSTIYLHARHLLPDPVAWRTAPSPPSRHQGSHRFMSGYIGISRDIPTFSDLSQLTHFYKLLTPLHAGNFEQPQNSWPTFFPDFALRFRMTASHVGHAGACSRLAMTSWRITESCSLKPPSSWNFSPCDSIWWFSMLMTRPMRINNAFATTTSSSDLSHGANFRCCAKMCAPVS